MGQTFYHVDRALALEPETKLEADFSPPPDQLFGPEFDDGITKHGNHHMHENGFPENPIEVILELVRRRKYPGKRSRFQSVFAFEELDRAKRFVEEYRYEKAAVEKAQIWEVEADQVTHRGDMAQFDQPFANLATGAELARKYWDGAESETPLWEVLLEPPVTVVDRVWEGEKRWREES